MSLKRRDAMRSRRSRQAIPFTTEEHEKINILIDKNQEKRKSHPESGDKLQEIKQMVTEVTVIMKDNIEKVVEREGKLNTLSVRTEELEASSQTFKISSTQVKYKYRSRHRRLVCVIISVIVFILLLGGIVAFLYYRGLFSQNTPTPSTTTPVNSKMFQKLITTYNTSTLMN